MKLKFKHQTYQTDAVDAIADCFLGQSFSGGNTYTMDPGKQTSRKGFLPQNDDLESGFSNADICIAPEQLLENIRTVQRRQNLPISDKLVTSNVCNVNLDIEMETGTGKTYCYISTMFELNRRYGWSKFIVVVPSIAIREGVYKSFEITAEHFQEQYGKKARFFIYNSKSLDKVEHFSSDSGINVMIINTQAFNARGKDARRIYEALDAFQSRRPIDVIMKNKPILIIDEPQKIEGDNKKASRTFESLKEFNPLMILRYSATHRKEHNKVYRLDALDAYNRKLVKKIQVSGVSVRGLSGTNAYLYLSNIEVSRTKAPRARIEIETKQLNGIKRVTRILSNGDNIYELSNQLEQYKGFTISGIDAAEGVVDFTNGERLIIGDATGDVTETALRRIQIREAVRTHLNKERQLYSKGIKVLTLFFIDEVAKYRCYEASEEVLGEYAKIFEQEYTQAVAECMNTLFDEEHKEYLRSIDVSKTHNGYFSIDKKSQHLVNPKTGSGNDETDDVDAYDLILRNKEQLLSFEEPTRFIFSHSALREGWDNPNVFVICTLKHSDNSISKRQEVGRGMRLCVDRTGQRVDSGSDIHAINELTVVAAESYKEFVSGLQKEIADSLVSRPRKADVAYFTGKVLVTEDGEVVIDNDKARMLHNYLLKNDYIDYDDEITEKYNEDKDKGNLSPLPQQLEQYKPQVISLIDTVFNKAAMPDVENNRNESPNSINNGNFQKREFLELWDKINKKAVYAVDFDSDELVNKAIHALNTSLTVSHLQYTVESGQQQESIEYDQLSKGEGFQSSRNTTGELTQSVHSSVKYDLVGQVVNQTGLKRNTITNILTGIDDDIFAKFRANPEDFIRETSRLINEQKATVIVKYLSYNKLNETFETDIFTADKGNINLSKDFKAKRHIYDYVITDSKTERAFVEQLDNSDEVVVYSKLPKNFFIPTPVGNYNPDWAIAFKKGTVKHIYFVAETKGDLSSLQFREIEDAKIKCARKFFSKITSDQVKYEVVNTYAKLRQLVS